MPSIAQQDYIVIAPKVGNMILNDAYALGQLAKILERKDTSIFDVILENATITENPDKHYSKIVNKFTLFTTAGVNYIGYIEDGEIKNLYIHYTSTQYEGLAAVQEAAEAEYPGQGGVLPEFELNAGVLLESVNGHYITDLEGHNISVTAADRKIASVAISDETDPDGIKVPFEEIQKFVGLPITV